ncbi:hypothetical protein [Curtobacterium sp. MCSS17_007]|uniref:hypothetical protein n=1 Tax=Curtobacterium sp. MCSS17_007 TaxID=2175646 RepID=UPI0011B4A663|nr:hypothetical protein [Curtobacterium sp. MCSS17_007]WIE76778.1 hypothetical protein DEJ22_005830 [Curtobacterium sp. MCSS17_007]
MPSDTDVPSPTTTASAPNADSEQSGADEAQPNEPDSPQVEGPTTEIPEASADATSKTTDPSKKPRKTRTPRSYPAASFLESLPLAEAIQRYAAGQRVRRLTLFDQMGRSADSGTSRQLVTNSSQYGLTKGSYQAEFLELTEKGSLASGDESLGQAKLAARLQLAIADVVPFNALYEQFKNNRMPAASVMVDFVVEQALTSKAHSNECVETFLANARDLGLLTTYAGAERLLTFEILLDEVAEELPEDDENDVDEAEADLPHREFHRAPPAPRKSAKSPAQVIANAADLTDVCFLVTPIGEEGSEQRMHADLMLGSLIEPALETLGLRIVRADRISTPGMITAQIIDHLVRAPLVIADLSFGNPNVFYELALRHASRLPAVQLIRSGDHLPFDVGQFRTVPIDMTSIFTLVPQIDTYRAEIARQCRAALSEHGDAESPLSLFYPRFWDQYGDHTSAT